MKILILHDMNNPNQEVPIMADDYSLAVPLGSGSAVRTRSCDAPVLVHETPEQIIQMLRDL